MKKLFFVYAWILVATGCILTSIASIHFFYLAKDTPLPLVDSSAQIQISASNESVVDTSDNSEMTIVVEAEDARADIVANFLERYNSPLEPHDYYGEKLVEIADQHNIDFRLLPAIAMQESQLCKKAPEGTHNCLGFGIHSRGTLGFESYEAAFERAARELKQNYIDQGRETPEEIMKKYTPSSNGSWASSVNQWMTEMRYDDRKKGITEKKNADLLEFVEESNQEDEISI